MKNRDVLIELVNKRLRDMDNYDLADLLSGNNGILRCMQCPFWDYCVSHTDEDARNQCYVTLFNLLESDNND